MRPTKLFVNLDTLMLVSLCGKKVEAMHWLNIFNMWSGIMNYKVVLIYIEKEWLFIALHQKVTSMTYTFLWLWLSFSHVIMSWGL
jgi:hypothetical protein